MVVDDVLDEFCAWPRQRRLAAALARRWSSANARPRVNASLDEAPPSPVCRWQQQPQPTWVGGAQGHKGGGWRGRKHLR